MDKNNNNNIHTTRKKAQLVLGIATVLTGAVIYILFRPTSLLIFRVFKALGLMKAISKIRALTSGIHLPDFIINCLPNALWVISYIIIMDYLWKDKTEITKLRWAVVVPVIGCVSEYLQLIHYIPGTFDIWDFLCYSIPFILYYIYLKTKNYEK